MTDGFVLYTSAVLGQSVIVLPSIAARHAGPWSILLWAGLAAVSYPLARVMAELGARYPSAGGVISFIGQGLGLPVGWLTGVLYLAAMAVGGPAAALIIAEYLGKLVSLTEPERYLVAIVVLGAMVLACCFDVSRVMRAQRWIFLACLGAVVVALALAVPHITTARLTDTSGYDLAGVAATGLLCFFSFVGWENAAFSGEEFADPRTLLKALGLAVAAVGGLFVLLGITVVGALSRATIAASDASLADLARLSLGAAGTGVASVIALIVLLVLMLTWTRSGTRLIFALAREGLFPHPFARVDAQSGAPRQAALLLAVIWAAAFAVMIGFHVSIEGFIQLASGNFLMTYVLIVVSAWRLLAGRRFLLALLVSSLAILLLLIGGYQSLWYPVATALIFGLAMLIRRRFTQQPQAAGAATSWQQAE